MHLAFVQFAAPAGVTLLVIAMFAILVLAGLWLIVTFFGGLFRRIPWVGPPIASVFDAAARGLRSATMATWHGTLWAVDHTVHAVATYVDNIVGIARDTLDAVGGALEHTVNVVIPREISQARAFATRQANLALVTALQYARSVRQDAAAWYRAGLAYTDGQVTSATRTVLAILGDATARLQAQISALRADTLTWVAAATARADRQFRQAEADAAVLAKQAEQAAIKTEQAAVDGQARDAWAPVWAGIMTGVAGAISVAGSDFPAITAQLQAIATQAPATLAEAETAAASAIPPMMTALEECVLPGCRDLGPLRTLMSQLADALFAALLLAWVVQMITDPQGWAQETYDAFGPLIDGELAVVRALAGI